MLSAKIVSGLEKCFLDQTPDDFFEINSFSMYKNEHTSVQVLLYDDADFSGSDWACRWLSVEASAPFENYIKCRMN